jgi:hypothetical protein
MTSTAKNLIRGRLGRTRETHSGSPTVLVERTMDDAASRTGIVPDHHENDDLHDHESVAHHVTGRLGLRPSEDHEAQQDEAHLPRREPVEPAQQVPINQIERPVITEAVEEPEAQHHSSALRDSDGRHTHKQLTHALKKLDLFQHDEHEEHHGQEDAGHQHPTGAHKSHEAREAARALHHLADETAPRRRKPRKRKRRKKCHRKSTFHLCSRTLRCLKAYSRVTGRWQYNLVGEALESYLELAITALDPESLKRMQEILNDLHHKEPRKSRQSRENKA